ncbi:Uma2 family endonuclease [Chondromyces apiculatus]|uniref:Putative restriction endonuclease domain-containing protein n=1 Tax=Chondromyces apiculatus DSM 436 TaxID=1192034 RepID=A0A017T0Y7_9BACT|nr:Uma2 family endonuclease [Chondromyces apiculatus]EYF02642.1 Hypothetical protein CAP_6672 [Chondromyces apiculatus DSM 436]
MGVGGPDGWIILTELRIKFASSAATLVPDLAGWRKERLPVLPTTATFTLRPDWVCEILSRSTASHDRFRKMPIYAREGVTWVWLIDPMERSLEVRRLGPDGKWVIETTADGSLTVRAPPFEELEFSLDLLWAGQSAEHHDQGDG